MQGAQLAELVEDQAHDVLYLLVRVEAHLARGGARIWIAAGFTDL